MKFYTLNIFFLFLFFIGQAQGEYAKVTGVVTSQRGQPVAGATVLLRNAKDTTTVKMTASDDRGGYEFIGLPAGTYFIEVAAVNYGKAIGKEFSITGSGTPLELTAIPLPDLVKSMQGVTVSARKPLIETKLDRTIVNVEAMISNAGLSVLDLLEKSPGVTIDNNDNIQLKGKAGVLILIDGRPTHLSGQDLANFLRNMPSNTLDQVEIMTQPPARYDASGNSGVINLRTKKNKEGGFNGSFSIGVIQAVYLKSPNSFNFNYRKGKVNWFGNASYAYWEGFNNTSIIRRFRDGAGSLTNVFDQKSFSRFHGRPLSIKTGMDFYAGRKTTLGFSLFNNRDHRGQDGSSRSDIFGKRGTPDSINYALSDGDEVWRNFSANVNFRQVIDSSGSELTGDLDYIQYTPNSSQLTNNYQTNASGAIMAAPYLLNGQFDVTIKVYSAKLDYVRPLKNKMQFEAGIKTSFVKSDNDAHYTFLESNQWTYDAARSNHFIYEERNNAGYVNLSRQWEKWESQLGLRMEGTVASGNQLAGASKFKRNYAQLFPTFYTNYHLDQKNTVGISYGRRINRPDYQDLNPFQFYIDKYTYQEGNPALRPQFTHNVELSFSHMGQLTVTGNFTRTTDIINDILRQDETSKVTLQTKENIASSTNIGLAVNFNKPLKKWWNCNVFANIFTNHFEGVVNNKELDVDAPAFSINTSNQFTIGKKGWASEFNGFFQTKRLDDGLIVGRPWGMITMGASKQILKKKGSIRTVIRDPFYTMKFKGYTRFDKIDADIVNRWDNRRFIVTFNYRFGKPLKQQQRRSTGGAGDEQSRVKNNSQN